MTLNQTIVSKWGVWQCTDHRLATADGKPVDDYSIKHVVLQCTDGTALLAYAGIGRIGPVDISDWIRETLRGESRTVDQSLVLIRENATRDIAQRLLPTGFLHMFSIGAFLAGRPWAAQIRNFNVWKGVPEILDHFECVASEIIAGQGFIFDPSGRAVTRSDLNKLLTAATKKPRDPKEFSDLMASINRRASSTPTGKRFISAGCLTSYVPPAGRPTACQFHGHSFPPLKDAVVPTVLFGIDLTEMTKMLMRSTRTGTDPEADRECAANQSVLPKNRLRR